MATGKRGNHWWQFRARLTKSGDHDLIQIWGESHIDGSGRLWDHTVSLVWHGCARVAEGKITAIDLLASGHEKLSWGRGDAAFAAEPDARHLMAGHPIDLDSDVVYGLNARMQQ